MTAFLSDVGHHDEQVGIEFARGRLTDQILVDLRLDAAAFAGGVGRVGMGLQRRESDLRPIPVGDDELVFAGDGGQCPRRD